MRILIHLVQNKYYELYTEKKNSMIASSLSDEFNDGFTLLISKTISID